VPEFYRKTFRTLVRGKWESYSNNAFRLNASMKAWLGGEQAQEDIEHLKQVLLIEQFTQCLPVELHKWVIERSPKTVSDAARFADEFAILYKPLKVEKFGSQITREIHLGIEIRVKMHKIRVRQTMVTIGT